MRIKVNLDVTWAYPAALQQGSLEPRSIIGHLRGHALICSSHGNGARLRHT